jgi:two-component system nitrate/nitrite response regulator NarL
LIRADIKEVLSADRLYNLLAVAETGDECIDFIRRHRPDVAIIDINISPLGAAGILREAKLSGWQTRIYLLTDGQSSSDALEADDCKTISFINARRPGELRETLRKLAIDLLCRNKEPAAASLPLQRRSPSGSNEGLTSRQKQIVAMLKVGSSNREIARILGLTEGTIKVHLHRIYQKIGVANRTQLAARSFSLE